MQSFAFKVGIYKTYLYASILGTRTYYTNVTILYICLGGGDYAYSAAYSQYSSAPYSSYGYGAATSGLLSK